MISQQKARGVFTVIVSIPVVGRWYGLVKQPSEILDASLQFLPQPIDVGQARLCKGYKISMEPLEPLEAFHCAVIPAIGLWKGKTRR